MNYINTKCPRCGIVHNCNFCPNCGLQAPQPITQGYGNQSFMYGPKPKSKMNGCLVAVITLFVIVVMLGVIGNVLKAIIPDMDKVVDSVNSDRPITLTPTPINVVFDATKFIIDNERTVSEAELIEMLGQPESIEEWNYESYQSLLGKEMIYPIRSLYYNENKYEYKFNNNMLQRITITEEFAYEDKNNILPMFGLKKYSNTKITDTNVAYRCSNCGIYEFWVYDMDSKPKTIKGIHISYGSLFE
ncbi:MAG: hypothetical protein K0R92_389 [Lachnospiraceae bacterium]|nr:hypothetical protein [Lachnospiraceae bacterium]